MTLGRNNLSKRATRRRPQAAVIRKRAAPVCESLECRTLLSATPIGPEFRANTYTAGDQSGGAVATDAAGNSVVVWGSALQDGSGTGVYAQRFDAAGAPVGGEFRVNTS